MRKPKITVIGGGTGIPVILKRLRSEDVEINAVVTVADDGGSSGKIRNAMQLAPPGDLRNVLLALSDMPKLYEQVFQYRFNKEDGALAGHPLGNLIIAGISEMQGSISNAMQILSQLFHTTGKIFPSSEHALTLHAVFKDGHVVSGESHIANYQGMIDHVYVTNSYNDQDPKASHQVVEAIMNSDMIVLGPGSLYTSILPNLVIPEIKEALKATKAEIVYICNIMTQYGETEHFSDADHVAVLNRHLGDNLIDTVLVNLDQVPQDYMDYNKFDEYLVQVEHHFSELNRLVKKVISSNFLRLENGGAFHDGDLVVEELMTLVKERRL
ncbi:YvcK family protein [Streptococcus halichoeri]|uniref:YvcK family protein n=1 Tax=Streptococcus halichoeri TaxID=254785 RepID=UPI0013579326|nr:YvcK family protein [Streptococcus halichoeri]